MVKDFRCYNEILLNSAKENVKDKEYDTSRIKTKICLLIALGNI